jgi:hypothetical protein
MSALIIALIAALVFAVFALYLDSVHTKTRKISAWIGASRALSILACLGFTLTFLLELTFNGVG